MAKIVIDWNISKNEDGEVEVVDIYPTNLIDLHLTEEELADIAYYDGIADYLASIKTP